MCLLQADLTDSVSASCGKIPFCIINWTPADWFHMLHDLLAPWKLFHIKTVSFKLAEFWLCLAHWRIGLTFWSLCYNQILAVVERKKENMEPCFQKVKNYVLYCLVHQCLPAMRPEQLPNSAAVLSLQRKMFLTPKQNYVRFQCNVMYIIRALCLGENKDNCKKWLCWMCHCGWMYVYWYVWVQ